MSYPPSTSLSVSILARAAKSACIPALLLIPLVLAPAPSIGPQVTVARFHGDYPGAFAFTFDDAMPTQLIYAAPYMNRVGLKGTFFLVTDIITDGEAGSPAIGKPTAWADWKAVADSGHEIASHTLTHPDLTTLPFEDAVRQMTESAVRIREKLGITPVTFAYPFHGRNAALDKAALRAYIAVREAQVGYGDRPGMANTARAMNRYADASVNQRTLRVGMVHGLTEPYASMDPGEFLEHLEYCRKLMDERKLWVAPFAAVSKYRIEKDAVRLTTVHHPSGASLEFTAVSPLDPQVFDQPLTFIVPYRGGAPAEARAARAGSSDPLPLVIEPGRFLVQAVPGPGAITVSWTP
jgi:peptidoglycan/xylan/chitin deacetylase (PgdA/CDA1 family)